MDIYDNTNVWEQIPLASANEGNELIPCEKGKNMLIPSFFSRSSDGDYLFLVRFPETTEPKHYRLTELASCQWGVSRIIEDAFFYTLALTDKESWWIFKMLCLAIYEELSNHECSTNDEFVARLNKVLQRYASFFRTARSAFSAEQALGLYGELLFLRNQLIPRYGIEQALHFWKGPEAAPKDFVLLTAEFEVKTTLDSGNARIIHISNLKQLSETPGKPLYLLLYTLRQTDEGCGQTLNALVDNIRMHCSDKAELLFNLLQKSKYDRASVFSEVPYEIANQNYYAIGADFPRLTTDSVPPELFSAKYSLNLEGVPTMTHTPEL